MGDAALKVAEAAVVASFSPLGLGYELPDEVIVDIGLSPPSSGRTPDGQGYVHPKPKPQINYYATLRFGIWWMGDLTRSAYSGGDVIRGYSTRGRAVWDQWKGDGSAMSNHGSKGAPCLIADLFGDWREELLLRRADNRAIRVYPTPEPTTFRFHTFLEDPVYRWSVATQMNGYNVPTGTGFYFGPDLLGHGIWFRGAFME